MCEARSVFFCPGVLVGFTNIGDINSHLHAFENSLVEDRKDPIAHSMLVLMVRGLFSHLEFPYAQFPCKELSGDQMYEPLWDAVGHLERCGFRVMALVCDGLAANRRLFRLHVPDTPASCVHKVANPYAEDGRHLFFLSDPPHLVKTVRNAWSSNKRSLWVRNGSLRLTCTCTFIYSFDLFLQCQGKDIAWCHLVSLYERNRSEAGLSLIPKLKFEHIHLTTFSKMRVDLAAQVHVCYFVSILVHAYIHVGHKYYTCKIIFVLVLSTIHVGVEQFRLKSSGRVWWGANS